MKKLFKFLRNFIIFAYMIVIFFVIISMLSYNNYGVTMIGNFTIIPVIDEDLQSKFVSGDLLIANKNEETSVKVGEEVLFYEMDSEKISIKYSKVNNIDYITGDEYEYIVEEGTSFRSSDFIGKISTSIVIPKVGTILEVLQSRQGFFYLVVLPLIIAFVYTLILAILEIKGIKNKNNKKEISEIESELKNEEKVKENFEDKIESVEKNTETIVENNEIENINEKAETELNTMTSEERKVLIQAKLNSMTYEEKKALVQSKLNSMTPEERKIFIEERKRKMN